MHRPLAAGAWNWWSWAVVDDDANMPMSIRVRRGGLHEGDELVAHVDEGLVFALSSKCELEDPAVESERLLHVADLKRDVVYANQRGLARSQHFVQFHGYGPRTCPFVISNLARA